MKTIIAGSRTITDYAFVKAGISRSGIGITEVVSGTARGPDKLGERWAREHGVKVRRFWPNWIKHGKRAGILRNEEMALYADALIAFWDGDSSGTRHMINYARRLGLPVVVWHPDQRDELVESV